MWCLNALERNHKWIPHDSWACRLRVRQGQEHWCYLCDSWASPDHLASQEHDVYRRRWRSAWRSAILRNPRRTRSFLRTVHVHLGPCRQWMSCTKCMQAFCADLKDCWAVLCVVDMRRCMRCMCRPHASTAMPQQMHFTFLVVGRPANAGCRCPFGSPVPFPPHISCKLATRKAPSLGETHPCLRVLGP